MGTGLTTGLKTCNVCGCSITDLGTSESMPQTRNGKQITLNGQGNGVPVGRWPSNLLHDGSDEVLKLFPQSKGACAPVKSGQCGKSKGVYGDFAYKGDDGASFHGDTGSASRFFYCAKASRSERGAGNIHPTVKPLRLMEYLIKLVTPEGAIVLDPFMGSGTTGIACVKLNRKFIGIERDELFYEIAVERIENELALVKQKKFEFNLEDENG